MPKTSPALAELKRFKPGMRGIAPHITGLRRLKYQIKTLGRGVPIEAWPWGSTGPPSASGTWSPLAPSSSRSSGPSVTHTAAPSRSSRWHPADDADVTGPGTAPTGRSSAAA